MAVKTNKILPFAVNAESNDLLSDDEYQKDVTRTGGNIVGIAKRRPNNKALKQASLIASALADIIARGSVFDGSKDDGYDIDDSLDRDTIAEYLFNTFTGIIKETSAGDNTLVHIANAETITGTKTFSKKIIANGGVQLPSNAPAGDNDAARKGYIDDNFTLLPINATTADANGFTTPQRLACPSTVANLPEAKIGFMDIYKAKDDNDIIQVYYLNDNSAIYARTSTNNGSTWSEWKLQTVSDLSAYVQTVNGVEADKDGNVDLSDKEMTLEHKGTAENQSDVALIIKNNAAEKGATISNMSRSQIVFTDKNNVQVAYIQGIYEINGTQKLALTLTKFGTTNKYVSIVFDNTGVLHIPTPNNNANGPEAVNAAWIKQATWGLPTSVFHKTGDAFIAEKNGFFQAQRAGNNAGTIFVNGNVWTNPNNYSTGFVPFKKGDKITTTGLTAQRYFYTE